MDKINFDQFEYSFTNSIDFKAKADKKFPCFRIIDDKGKVVNKEFESAVEKEKLIKIFEKMVEINETDATFNQAQR